MPRVYVSLGSNINPEENIRSGVLALKKEYPNFTVSSVYRNKAVGFEGDDFYNLVAKFESDKSVYSIVEQLKYIESQHNRTRNRRRFSSRTLDIDLLLYGDLVISEQDLKLPRDEITRYAFVLYPLSEIAGQLRHPVTGKTYKELWQEFDNHSQQLQRINFQW
jgi:2-amino-4-hydroxy-6-hydroxymethyldihydropteridine diphosphokinase